MKVLVLGATGKIGVRLVKLLREQGHQVVAFVHSSNPFHEDMGVSVAKGDVHNQADLAAALDGVEAVISTLGSWHTKQKDILSVATKNIVPLMEKSGPKRIITLTGSDAHSSADTPTFMQKLLRPVFKTIAPKILVDSEQHITLLQASTLDWTIVRSPVMRSFGARGTAKLRSEPPAPWATVHCDDVAKAILTQLNDTSFLYKLPHIY